MIRIKADVDRDKERKVTVMEEVEIVRVAMQGTDMFLRLAGAGIKQGLLFLKGVAMFGPNAYRWWQEAMNMHMKKELTKEEYAIIKARQEVAAGSMNSEQFMKVFSAEERIILNIPDTSAERFGKLAKSNGLTYTIMADLNPEDGFFQIMVPKSQSDIYKLIIDKMAAEELNEIEAMKGYLENEIEILKKQRAEIKSDLNKMKEEGKTDTEEYIKKAEELDACNNKINKLNYEFLNADKMRSGEMTAEEYMKTNEFAFKHADLFAALMEEGITADGKSIFTLMQYKNEKADSLNVKDFETAVTEVTKRKDIRDTDEKIVICNAENPETYIEARSYTKEREGRTYICTQYDLYVDGKKQTSDEFSHGEFTHYSDSKAGNSSEAGDLHWNNMKAELKEKGKFSSQAVVFASVSEYREYADKIKNGPEISYIVNPNVPDMAVRRERGSADSYTIIMNGEDTSVTFIIDGSTKKELTMSYIKQIEFHAHKINKEADLHSEWIELPEEHYKKWTEITDTGKTPSEGSVDKDADKEQEDINKKHNEEFEAVMPEDIQAQVKAEGRAEAEQTKSIIEIPNQNIFIFDKDSDVFVFADDMSCRAILPSSKVKTTAEGKKLLLLEAGESISILERNNDMEIGKITNQLSFDNFINGKAVTDKNPVRTQNITIGKER